MTEHQSDRNSFLDEAGKQDEPGLIGEFVQFMRENAKWWLTPILVVFGIVAVLLILGGTGLAPFLYTLW